MHTHQSDQHRSSSTHDACGPDHDHAHGHDHSHGHAPSKTPTQPSAAAAAPVVADDPCDCAGHRLAAQAQTAGTGAAGHVGWLSSIAPVLACALCPVCLSAYAAILSAFGVGVGFAISDRQHAILLVIAVVLALSAAVWRARITRHYSMLALTVVGCVLLLLGENLGDNRILIGLGMALLVGSMILDRVLRISNRRTKPPAAVA